MSWIFLVAHMLYYEIRAVTLSLAKNHGVPMTLPWYLWQIMDWLFWWKYFDHRVFEMSKELTRTIRHIDYHLKFQSLHPARGELILEKHLWYDLLTMWKSRHSSLWCPSFYQIGRLPMRQGLFCRLRGSTLAPRGICEYWWWTTSEWSQVRINCTSPH